MSKKSLTRFLQLTLAFVFLSCTAEPPLPVPLPEIETSCFDFLAPFVWSFCVNKTKGSHNPDLLYHMHAREGAANWWNDEGYYTTKVHRVWKSIGVDPPTVITISFGKFWVLTERPDLDHRGLFRFFVDQAMPLAEKKVGGTIRHRLVLGESMGGINALILALRLPERFTKVASLCPVLPQVSPHAGWGEKLGFMLQKGVTFKRSVMMLLYAGQIYPSEEIWQKNDPLNLVEAYDPSKSPKLFVNCGAADEWGCMLGSKKIVQLVQSRGGDITWEPRLGGHCDIDESSVARFLLDQ